MQIDKPIEEILPELRPVVDLLQTKFHKNLIIKAVGNSYSPSETDPQSCKTYANKLMFMDTRFPRMPEVGHIKYLNGVKAFEVYSHHIENEKYRRNSFEYHTKRASDPKKVLKLADTFIRPFTPQEVMATSIDYINRNIRAWREEYRSKVDSGFYSLSTKTMYTEIGHLLSMGVTFTTPQFQEMATVKYPLYLEHIQRAKTLFARYHIYKLADGRVFVTRKDEHKDGDNETPTTTETYTSIDALPENILGKYALLNMVGGEDPTDGDIKPSSIPEVGVRLASDEFFVIEPLDNATNA